MKKTLLFGLMSILLMGVLSCGEPLTTLTNLTGDSTVTETEPVTFSFSWWGTADRNIATYEAIELFESRYPQYTVSGNQAPWDGYQVTLYNMLEQGMESDIIQVNYNWLYSMHGEYFFMDLQELGIDFSHYPENEHLPLTVDGKVLGLSLSETGYIFYLNKKVYDDAGITEIPDTWDELIAAGQAIGEASDGQKFAIGRLDAQQVAILIFSWLAQKYGRNIISDSHQLNYSRSELEEAFAFINDLRSNNVLIPNNRNDTHTNGPTNPNWVTYQKYGGILQWNTAVSEYENELPDSSNLVMAGLFQQNEGEELGMYKKVSMALAVSQRLESDPAKKQAVKTFLEFMTTDPDAVKILGVDRGVPGNQLAYQVLLESTEPVFTGTLEWQGHHLVQSFYDHQIGLGQDLYIHPYYEHDMFRRIYEMPIEKFLFNEYTANEAVSDIIRRFNTTLAEVMGG